MNVNDGHPLRGVALHARASDFAGLVGGVVQDLHVQQFGWVVETLHGFCAAKPTESERAMCTMRMIPLPARALPGQYLRSPIIRHVPGRNAFKTIWPVATSSRRARHVRTLH